MEEVRKEARMEIIVTGSTRDGYHRRNAVEFHTRLFTGKPADGPMALGMLYPERIGTERVVERADDPGEWSAAVAAGLRVLASWIEENAHLDPGGFSVVPSTERMPVSILDTFASVRVAVQP